MINAFFGTMSDSNAMLMQDMALARNLSTGGNPDYSLTDFLADFPQFSNQTVGGGSPMIMSSIPETLAQKFITMASAALAYSRYQDNWSYCMGLYVAHFCSLFLSASAGTTPSGVASAAAPKSILSSKSVGDVSASYDTNAVVGDLEKWGSFKSTTYGQQLSTFANIAGMGGMLT